MTIYTGFEIEVEGCNPNQKENIRTFIENTRRITGWTREDIANYHENEQYSLEGKWRVERDDSLYSGVELISPVLPFKESLEQLFEVLKQIDISNCRTTRRCGLHMSISADNMTLKDFDLPHFMSNLDQGKLYSLWKSRLEHYNTYCVSIKDILYQITNSFLELEDIDAFSNKLVNYRHNMINLRTFYQVSRGVDKKYFEIRLMGGEDYHKKIEKIKITANYFANQIKKTYSVKKKSYKKIISYMNRTKNKKNIFSKIWMPRSNYNSVKGFINKLKTSKNLNECTEKEIIKLYINNNRYANNTTARTFIKNYIKQLLNITQHLFRFNTVTLEEHVKILDTINETIYYLLKFADRCTSRKFCNKLVKDIHYKYFLMIQNLRVDLKIKTPTTEKVTDSLWLIKYIKLLDEPLQKEYIKEIKNNAAKFIIKYRKKEVSGIIRLMNTQIKKNEGQTNEKYLKQS